MILKQNLNSGFTLLELLLYIGISMSVLLLSAMFLWTTLEARVKNETLLEVDQQGVVVMEILTNAIRGATSITTPAPGVTQPSLTLAMPTPVENPTVFSVSSGVLYIQQGVSAPVALTNGLVTISEVTFKNLTSSGTPGAIQIAFIISRTNTSGRQEYTYSKNFLGGATLRQP